MSVDRWLYIYRVLVISITLGLIVGAITADGPR